MAFSLDKAELVSLLVEAILYGLYTFLFCCTVYVLVHKRSSPRIHIGMLIATLLLFALATTHLITNFLRLMDAFNLAQTHPGAASVVLKNQSSPKNLLRMSVLVAEFVIGDIVLIYRCYVAWTGSLRVIIPPVVVVIGTMASSSGMVYTFANMHEHEDIFAFGRLQHFITATQVLVLVNNVYCTSMLAWKLWIMSRSMVSRSQRETLRSVALIIAESGLLTAVTWIIFVIVYATRSNGEIIVLDSLAPITGCAFCLIVSRVALGLETEVHAPPLRLRDPDHDPNSPNADHESAIHSPVLDGPGGPHRAVEIRVSSRHSVRVESQTEMMEMLYQDKKAIAGLGIL